MRGVDALKLIQVISGYKIDLFLIDDFIKFKLTYRGNTVYGYVMRCKA